MSTARAARPSWDEIKKLRPAEPEIVVQPDIAVVFTSEGKFAGAVNRAWRRGAQGRFRGFAQPRAVGARLTPVDPDGRASGIRANRAARREQLAAQRQAVAQ